MEAFNPTHCQPISRPRTKLKMAATSPSLSSWLGYCHSDVARRYAQQLADLFTSDTGLRRVQMEPTASPFNLTQANSTAELVAYEEPVQPWLKRVIFGSPACRIIQQLSVSTLIVRQPRWPVQHILFVTRGQWLDYVALKWLVPLARATQSPITVLAIQPYLSATNSRALYGASLSTWLPSDTPLGQQLRSIVQQCPHPEKIHLKFMSGDPRRQIQQAVANQQPDLIVLASDPPNWYERRLLGNLVDSLLGQADRPFLVVKGSQPVANDYWR